MTSTIFSPQFTPPINAAEPKVARGWHSHELMRQPNPHTYVDVLYSKMKRVQDQMTVTCIDCHLGSSCTCVLGLHGKSGIHNDRVLPPWWLPAAVAAH